MAKAAFNNQKIFSPPYWTGI